MSPRIDISIDELPEASSLLDGHDYSSQIIQRIAGVPVILDAVSTATSVVAKGFRATVPTVPGCDIAAVAALVDKFVIWVATR